MKKHFLAAAFASTAILLASCGSNDEGAQAPAAGATDQAMTADPNNPFGEAEMAMNEKMMTAVGTDAGDSWAKKMIVHHQGAIDMSQIMLEQSPNPDVEKMTRDGIEKQQKDIEDIRKLTKDGAPDQKSADLYRPAMMDMHEKMMAAKGADASETFMRKMLEHHRGAVVMSDVALQNGVTGALRQQIQKTRDENQKEAEMVEAMLGGKSHAEAMAASGAKPAAQMKAEPAPADKPKAAETRPTAAAAKPTPKPKPTQAAGGSSTSTPAATATCLPEHRAAGHC